MTMTIDLASLCDPDGMLLVQKPRDVVVDGQPAVFASDGKCGLLLFGVPACGNDLSELGAKAANLRTIINAKRQWLGATTAVDVRKWAGEYEPPKPRPCSCCGGDGQCECDQCGAQHDCGVCNGSGKMKAMAEVREGIAVMHVIDRNKVAKVFGLGIEGPCRIGVGLSAPLEKKESRNAILEFRGDGWRAYFAPMDRTVDVPHGDWPVLEMGATP